MTLLALDTSAHLCAACIYDGKTAEILAERSDDIGRGHAEVLLSVITDCLAQANLDYKALSAIGVMIGPGSFTGVRVGIATARGLALALEIPVIGVSTLDAVEEITRDAGVDGPLATLLNAGRDQAYCKISGYENTEQNMAPCVLEYTTIANRINDTGITVCGSGSLPVQEQLDKPVVIRNEFATAPISTVAKIADNRIQTGTETSSSPEPLYLRPPDAKPQAGFVLPHV